MTQRDVVLRWIEQIVRVVRRMLLGPGPPDLAAARTQLEEATTRLLGPLALLVPQLDPPSAAQLLHDPGRLHALAQLLELEAVVREAEGDAAGAAARRERAAAFQSLAGGCPQCGAWYPDPEDSCAERFSALLALDHSRAAPWGPLHGVVFACYTLQHPADADPATVERSWLVLHRLITAGADPRELFAVLRRTPAGGPPGWEAPALPPSPAPGGPYDVTIADLGDFPAAAHREGVDAWARATYARWAGGLNRL